MTTTVKSEQGLQAMFGALGDPTRYKIVRLLIDEPELCVSEVADRIGVSTAAISQHMKMLEQSGLVRPQRMGQRTCYLLRSEGNQRQTILKLIK